MHCHILKTLNITKGITSNLGTPIANRFIRSIYKIYKPNSPTNIIWNKIGSGKNNYSTDQPESDKTTPLNALTFHPVKQELRICIPKIPITVGHSKSRPISTSPLFFVHVVSVGRRCLLWQPEYAAFCCSEEPPWARQACPLREATDDVPRRHRATCEDRPGEERLPHGGLYRLKIIWTCLMIKRQLSTRANQCF